MPKWKGECDAARVAGGPTALNHTAPHQRCCHRTVRCPRFHRCQRGRIARAAGIARRTLFRYYASKNAIPWGDFSTHLAQLQGLLDNIDSRIQLRDALRAALLAFNTFDESETIRHRKRMRVILQTPELQAYSMTMYAGWREVIAKFVARRSGGKTTDFMPQTVAWTMLGVALSAYEHWLRDESVSLTEALGAAFDVVGAGLDRLNQ